MALDAPQVGLVTQVTLHGQVVKRVY